MRFYPIYLSIILVSVFLILQSCIPEGEEASIAKIREMEYSRQPDAEQLQKWLNRDNPAIRLNAIRTIGAMQDSSLFKMLANGLLDEDSAVRGAAAFGVGQLFGSHPGIDGVLVEAMQRESIQENKVLLLEAIGKSASPAMANGLSDYLKSRVEPLQRQTALSLANMAYRQIPLQNFSPKVSKIMTRETSPELATAAAYSVYRIGALDAFRELSQSLDNSKSPLFTFFVLKGLRKMAYLMESEQFQELKKRPPYSDINTLYVSRNFRRSLHNQLQDSTWYVRQAALEVLSEMKDQTSQNEIVKMLDDPHPNVQIQAIRSLKTNYLNWYSRREMRRIYANAVDWRLKGEALAVLALMRPNEALRNVERDLLDKSWPQGYYAIKTLENIRTSDPARPIPEATEQKATELLMQLADGQNRPRTTLALEVLVTRNKVPEIKFFLDRLRGADTGIATVVATYLAKIEGDKPAMAAMPLIDAYQNFEAPRDLEAMVPILEALGNLENAEAVSFLRSELQNPHPTIRSKAIDALTQITKGPIKDLPEVQGGYATRWDFPPVSNDSVYAVTFFTTGGDFTIEMFPEEAPVTVANFVSLVKRNYYNDIYIHRVEPGFVVQAGDPRGDGWGGPGYSIPCEYNRLRYERGSVGMALSGKDTGGSQFFVTHAPQPHLNGKYTLFGKVTRGMKVVDRLMIYDRIQNTSLQVRKK